MSMNTPTQQRHSKSKNRVLALVASPPGTQGMSIVTWLRRPLMQRLLLLLAIAIILLSFGEWVLHSSHTSFAKTTSFEVCATALAQDKPRLCNGADPVQGGCSADAETVTHLPIMMGNQQIGLGELRFSPQCQTDWARGFSYLVGTTVSVFIADPTSTYNSTFVSKGPEAYSNMVFGKVPVVLVGIILSPNKSVSVQVSGK